MLVSTECRGEFGAVAALGGELRGGKRLGCKAAGSACGLSRAAGIKYAAFPKASNGVEEDADGAIISGEVV